MAKGRRKKKGRRRSAGDALKKVRVININKGQDIWGFQRNLRNAGYFARAVGPHKMVTTAPKDVA